MKLTRGGGFQVYETRRYGSSAGWRYYLWCIPVDHTELREISRQGIELEVTEEFFVKVQRMVEQGEKHPVIGLYLEDE